MRTPEQIVDAYREHYRARNAQEVRNCLAENVQAGHISHNLNTMIGRDTLMDYLEAIFRDPLAIETTLLRRSVNNRHGTFVTDIDWVQYTHPDLKSFEGVTIYKIENGLISRIWTVQ